MEGIKDRMELYFQKYGETEIGSCDQRTFIHNTITDKLNNSKGWIVVQHLPRHSQ